MSYSADTARGRLTRPAQVGDAYRWLLDACRRWILDTAGRHQEAASGVPCQEPDWTLAAQMAHLHGVEPLLHSLALRVRPFGSAVPDGLRERWEKAYYSTRILNAEALDAVSRILDRCHETSTDLLVLKGPAVVADVHRDIGLRPMADLDLLCRKRALPVVTNIAKSLGFSAAGAPYVHHLVLLRERDGMLLELHYDVHHFVTNKARFLEGAWRDRVTASIEGWRFPVMSPEHQAVFEIEHFASHGFDLGLKHVVDCAARLMLYGCSARRETLSALLDEAGLKEAYALVVGTIQRLLDLPLDASIGASLAPGRLEAFETAFFERSRSFGLVQKRISGSGFLRQRGVAKKAMFAWQRLFPPLVAIQAAYGARSSAHAVLYVPACLGRTLTDLVSRLKEGV